MRRAVRHRDGRIHPHHPAVIGTPGEHRQHEDIARDFLAFLTSETADAVFRAVGFSPMHE